MNRERLRLPPRFLAKAKAGADPTNLNRDNTCEGRLLNNRHYLCGSAFFILRTMAEKLEKLKKATVGIAGLGGLGSTVAVALTRAGIGRLIIADFDKIEKTNLNRQHYFLDQIGRFKVDALTENIKMINPDVKIKGHILKLTEENIPQIFAQADIIAECFDKADQKQMLVQTVLTKIEKAVIVSASGLAGYGKSNQIQTRRVSSRLILVGDNESGTDTGLPLTAPRVWIAASHQANAIIEILIDEIIK
jgi:sulfur carrier protein ThiS adenylyltransferase